MLSQSTALNSIGIALFQVIGEGATQTGTRVRLGVSSQNNETVAVKIVKKIPGKEGQILMTNLLKEVKIHSSCSHENIIKLYSTTEDEGYVYLILEYAAAGELFDRIAPDVGIGEDLAHFYFSQLLNGMVCQRTLEMTRLMHLQDYIHERGIAHRDLKPENLLLDINGNLKIIDFGLATVFRHKGVARILTTPCGSPPYVSPEIHTMHYKGDLSDIWSAGVILYVMLAGNTPWAEPTQHDGEFLAFNQYYGKGLPYAPWNTFSSSVLELIRGILNVQADARFTSQDIRSSEWFNRPQPMLTDGRCNNPVALAERMKSKVNLAGENLVEESIIFAYSQPMEMRVEEESQEMVDYSRYRHTHDIVSFSQPVRMDVGLSQDVTLGDGYTTRVLDSQINRPNGAFMEIFPSERITRFYSQYEPETILQRLSSTLDQFLVPYRENLQSRRISFSTVDKRKCPMQGEIMVQNVGEDMCLVTFRKSRGDPLEWKRFYHAIKESVFDLVHQ